MEDVARAVGATGSEVTIAGKQCRARPLGVVELCEVHRECLKQYKRQYLQTYYDNLDLLSEEVRNKVIREKMDEVALWDLKNLPAKFVCNPNRMKVNDQLIDWLAKNVDFEITDGSGSPKAKDVLEFQARRMAAAAVDADLLDVVTYENLVGEPIKRQRVGYVNWWITADPDGMLTFVWMAFREFGVTKAEVAKELGSNKALLTSVSYEIEHLTAPAVGNG